MLKYIIMNEIKNLDELFPAAPAVEAKPKKKWSEAVTYVLVGFLAAGLTFSLFMPAPATVIADGEPVSVSDSSRLSTWEQPAQPDAINAEGEDSNTTSSEGIIAEADSSTDPSLPYKAKPLGSSGAGTESGFPAELLDDAVVLATKMRGSVVQITGVKNNSGFGTGWLVQPDIVVTNEHVADHDADYFGQIAVKTLAGKIIPAEVVGVNAMNDVAILRLEEPIDAPLFKLYNGIVENGTPVLYTGNASNIGNWETGAGIITDNAFYEGEALVTSLPISPGASGSAIMNMDGVVVGIVAGTYWGTEDPGLRPPKDDVFIHTYMPRLNNNGGSNSLMIIKLLKRHGISYEVVEELQ